MSVQFKNLLVYYFEQFLEIIPSILCRLANQSIFLNWEFIFSRGSSSQAGWRKQYSTVAKVSPDNFYECLAPPVLNSLAVGCQQFKEGYDIAWENSLQFMQSCGCWELKDDTTPAYRGPSPSLRLITVCPLPARCRRTTAPHLFPLTLALQEPLSPSKACSFIHTMWYCRIF